jgi:hypothetical protein
MMAGMGKAEGLGPGFLDDGQQDVDVTGTLPMSMTTFVGRDQELGEIRSLFRGESDLSPWLASEVSVRPAWPWSWGSAPVTWLGERLFR